MALPEPIADAFHRQAEACDDLGSPFTARLCRLLAERLPRGRFSARIANWQGNLADAALALRAVGGLHALARSGRCTPLTAAYPPNVSGDQALWDAVAFAAATEDAFLAAWLDSPPQTNEVARSSAILGGCLWITDAHTLPLEILEIGSSAGLNLSFDRYAYELGAATWGPTEAAVRIPSRWEGDLPPLDAPLEVVARRGADAAPLNPGSARDRERLLSYVWADQTERLARTVGALDLAERKGIRVEQADAADWIEARMGEAPPPGRVRVILHTIVWQYLDAATRARIKTAMSAAGRKASPDAPLAWLSVEADGTAGSANIRLTLWPGAATVSIGRADFHGRWVRWQRDR